MLISATVNNADLLDLAGEVETIEQGKSADLIAVRGNPLQSIEALEKVVFVMRGGTLYVNRTGR